eukprot:TRINITY_DN5846_c0_g1_i2.p1 TRINITY_DN5846_c0_g1~~TRINITY_DN5846_c0_g1_i2.p1  ORF type:complete len:758 (+),score=68.98 TRINITY_DN5846_c0_g1_i2:88-2361(+)
MSSSQMKTYLIGIGTVMLLSFFQPSVQESCHYNTVCNVTFSARNLGRLIRIDDWFAVVGGRTSAGFEKNDLWGSDSAGQTADHIPCNWTQLIGPNDSVYFPEEDGNTPHYPLFGDSPATAVQPAGTDDTSTPVLWICAIASSDVILYKYSKNLGIAGFYIESVGGINPGFTLSWIANIDSLVIWGSVLADSGISSGSQLVTAMQTLVPNGDYTVDEGTYYVDPNQYTCCRTARTNHASFYDDYLYLVGGSQQDSVLDDICQVGFKSNNLLSCKQITTMPEPKSFAAYDYDKNTTVFIMHGGTKDGLTETSSMFTYTRFKNESKIDENIDGACGATAMSGHTGFILDGSFYVYNNDARLFVYDSAIPIQDTTSDTTETTTVINAKSCTSSDCSGDDLNPAYIAGPVAAFVAIVAIITAAIIIARKRRSPKKKSDLESTTNHTDYDTELRQVDGIPEIKEVVIGQRLGAGNFGEVYAGQTWGTTAVALKKLKKELIDEFFAEASILSKLKHPHIVQFLGVYTEPKTQDRYIVTEFCQQGSLTDVLENKRDQLSLDQLLEFASGACNGMVYLESQNIVHRDLSARNLLVDQSGNVKVADFGLSRATDVNNYYESSGSKFPIRWSAPEVLKFAKFSSKSDVWSMGITLYEIITFGRVPYSGFSNDEVVHKILEQKYRMAQPAECTSNELWQLMCDCWNEIPSERPSFDNIATRIDAVRKGSGYMSPTISFRTTSEDHGDISTYTNINKAPENDVSNQYNNN